MENGDYNPDRQLTYAEVFPPLTPTSTPGLLSQMFPAPQSTWPVKSIPSSTVTQASMEQNEKKEDKPEDTGSLNELVHDFYCGIYKWRPRLLQIFVSAKFFIPLLCFNALLQSALVNGVNSAVLSSIERRYRFGSTQASFILSTYDFSVVACVLFVSYFGGRGHKPRWLGWGMVILGIGALMFASPHFIYGRYTAGLTTQLRDELCVDGQTADPDCDTTANTSAYILFIVSQIITGIGTAGIYTVGLSYLDDIVHPKWVSIIIGVFFLCSIFGPALGFLVGGAFLTIYVDPGVSTELTEDDPLWVGAWWIMHVLIGGFSILLAIPVLMFPRFTPSYHIIMKARQKVMAKRYKSRYGEEKRFSEQLKSFPIHLKKLLTNPTWLFIAIGVISLLFSLNALVGFGPKYVESQFGVSASTAGVLVGAAAIVSAVTGIATGAGIMQFLKGKGRKAAFVHAVAVSIAVLPVFGFFAYCPTPNIAGISTEYATGPNNVSDELDSPCNEDCECSSTIFEPVCGADGVTYFSPCRAGCHVNDSSNDPEFLDCTCVFDDAMMMGSGNMFFGNGTAEDGRCSQQCDFIAVFVICIIILSFLVFVSQIAIVTVNLRCVADEQRSLSLGLNSFLSRLFGSVPGPILIGKLFDLSCIHFQDNCDSTSEGNCLVYDNKVLALRIFAVSVSGIIVDMIFAWLAWFFYKDAPQPTEACVDTNTVAAVNPIALSDLNKQHPDLDDEEVHHGDTETGSVEEDGDLVELVEL